MVRYARDFKSPTGNLNEYRRGNGYSEFTDANDLFIGSSQRIRDGVNSDELEPYIDSARESMFQLFKRSSLNPRRIQPVLATKLAEHYDSADDVVNEPCVGIIAYRGKPLNLNEADKIATVLSSVLERNIKVTRFPEDMSQLVLHPVSLKEIAQLSYAQLNKGTVIAEETFGPHVPRSFTGGR